MMDEHLKEQASLYVAGALTAVEASQFEQAMLSSLELQMFVKELRLSMDALVAGLPRRTPSPQVKAKLMRQIDQRVASVVVARPAAVVSPVWLQLLPWAMAACLTFLCVVLLSKGNAQRDRVRQLELELQEKVARLEQSEQRIEDQQTQARQQRNEFTQKILQQAAEQLKNQAATEARYLERVKQIQREKTDAAAAANPSRSNVGTVIGNDGVSRTPGTDQAGGGNPELLPGTGLSVGPNTQTSFLGVLRARPETGSAAIGAVSWDARDQRGTVVVEQLLPPTEKDYQLWLFTDDGRIVSGGLLKADAEGHVATTYLCGQPIRAVTSFKVTLERAGGVSAPGQGTLMMESN